MYALSIRCLGTARERFSQVYGAHRIGIFGSVTRGEAKPDSDLDVLVEMAQPTFDRYMDLKFEMEAALEMPVDLVLADAVNEGVSSGSRHPFPSSKLKTQSSEFAGPFSAA